MSPPPAAEVPYGTLDLMVLKTLASLGPQHGYGIARRIEQVADGALALNQGTIYPALLRLEQKGWIASEWGTSENNRRARFYSITAAGRKQLDAEAQLWARTVVDGEPPPGAGVMTRLRVLLARLLGTLTGRRREDDLREELETHLELLADEHRRRGLSDAEARLAARRELGGVAQTREAFRDTRVLPGIDALRQDVRFAWRALMRDRGTTFAAIALLTIGVSSTVVLADVLDRLLLRPPTHVDDPSRVRRLYRRLCERLAGRIWSRTTSRYDALPPAPPPRSRRSRRSRTQRIGSGRGPERPASRRSPSERPISTCWASRRGSACCRARAGRPTTTPWSSATRCGSSASAARWTSSAVPSSRSADAHDRGGRAAWLRRHR